MSAIARVLSAQGYQVSGSDLNKSEMTSKLEVEGIKVFIGHQPDNLSACEALVVSTAIKANNPELQAAKERGIPIFHRSEIVAYLMASKKGIAVAGAHGKTTTTSMLALVLEKAGLDPTILIGGELELLGGNAKLGGGEYLVAEADESDGSFVNFSPQMAIVTNIENDHMDYYHTMDNIFQAFREFLYKLPPESGLAVLCFDSENVRNIAKNLERRYISYGIEQKADYMARDIRPQGPFTIFDVFKGEELLGTVKLGVPGRHNVCNSLAVIVIALQLGLTFNQINDALAVFQGAKRRFQTKGRVRGIWVVDDYAHHPTEVATTLQAARQTEPQRLICVFQPHRYSRTQLLQQEFGQAFLAADQLILTDVYAAGEEPLPGIDGETIKKQVEAQTSQRVVYIQDKDKIARYLSEFVEAGDLVVTMGAGNIYQAGEQLVERLTEKE